MFEVDQVAADLSNATTPVSSNQYDYGSATGQGFEKMAPLPTASGEYKCTAAVERLDSVDDLPRRVKKWVKAMILRGYPKADDPTPPDKEIVKGFNDEKAKQGIAPTNRPYSGRSDAIFGVIGYCKYAGVADGIVLNILTDDRWGISGHCNDNAGEDTARRQIERWRKDHPDFKERISGDDDQSDKPDSVDFARTMIAQRPEPIIHLSDCFYTWRAGHYYELEDGIVRSEVQRYLKDDARQKVNAEFVSSVKDAVKSEIILDRNTYQAPCWRDGRTSPDPFELLPCRNGLVHIPTRTLLPHDPNFLTFNALDYDFDPDAPVSPDLLEFLDSVFPGDEKIEIPNLKGGEPEIVTDKDCIYELQKMFGLFLVPDTRYQKIFILRGPTRSGKGTILRILEGLLGRPNICSPNLLNMGESKEQEVFIGKLLCMLPDLRLSKRADLGAISELLLKISGEDQITFARKFKSPWTGRLKTRFLIACNDLPILPDPSGALLARYIVIKMRQSFEGREDLELTERLLMNRTGILNWALQGYQNLKKDGNFYQPKSSISDVREILMGSSKTRPFVDECCELKDEFLKNLKPEQLEFWPPEKTNKDFRAAKSELYQCYVGWARTQGQANILTKSQFGSDLLSACMKNGVKDSTAKENGHVFDVYAGIRVTPEKKTFLLEVGTNGHMATAAMKSDAI